MPSKPPPRSNTYTPAPLFPSLGDGFFDEVRAADFPMLRLRFRNQRWAERVGLGGLDDAAWQNHFGAFAPLPGNLQTPLALRYHGHQFGIYNPALGDGRGFLFAQLRDDRGRLLDLGTKGSGTTPWSRGGDGRLTLKGGVREVLATEMLEALGVPTSKSFSLFETGEMLFRGDEPSPTRSSVLVRLSHSHVRFGTFQRHAHARDPERLERLLAFSIANYVPEADVPGSLDERAAAFVAAVAKKSARLVAAWLTAGFVHGVLNTDNMSITGESFDYGPYRFLPTYDPDFVAAYFDQGGMYAFGRQATVVLWNVTRLAEALLVLCPNADFRPALASFEDAFHTAMQRRLCARLGLVSRGTDDDSRLADVVFTYLDRAEDRLFGYERFFFDAFGGAHGPRFERLGKGAAFDALREVIGAYEMANPAMLSHPYYASGEAPCTLLIDEIEAIWEAIDTRDDWSLFESKIANIRAIPPVGSSFDDE